MQTAAAAGEAVELAFGAGLILELDCWVWSWMMMEGIGRARASAQWVVSKLVESRLCELRPTIGGGDMIELLRLSAIELVLGLWKADSKVYSTMIQNQQ